MTADTAHSAGRGLFIVDNSVSGWTGLRYLEEWSGIAKAFDIATGYFEIGALLALDGKWQGLDKIRILMGSETTHRTRKALLDAVRAKAVDQLDTSLEDDKKSNPFLHGVDSILEALRSGKIECRVYDRDKFHAKTYITHARLEVVGAQALVGSSNFTRPGLTENVELNVQVQSAREVGQLQEWFETHWGRARDVSAAVIDTIARHTHLYSPFEVYAKALQEYFRGHELTATEWDESRSLMFGKLDRYQQEAYWALMKIARRHGGAFLCDGVGLGKTFVGLMLIERLILHENKRVVLFAPKAAREGVWEPHLREWLGHIGGFGGGADFSNLAVFNHTDLGRKGGFPERFKRITALADAVIIDEAHHFRNPGRRGDPDKGIQPSRYHRMYDLLDSSERRKNVFMLTATPINNRLSDFRHMAELFTRRDDKYFARTIGVNHLTAHFTQMERALRDRVGAADATAVDHMDDAQDILDSDEIFGELVVQRSRRYARESQIQEHGAGAAFPDRKPPQVASYSVRKTYGGMLDLIDTAFAKQNPLFTLPMYYPLHWYTGPDTDIDPLEEGRQKQVVGLIRTNFLKRFESSVAAFELSCDRLLKKLLAFLEVHSESPSEKKRLARWRAQNAEALGYAAQRHFSLWGDDDAQDEDAEDVVPAEMLAAVERLDRAEYNVGEMMSETFLDLDQIVQFLNEARRFEARHDDKLKKLVRLLKSKALAGEKVLVFTEFADTARYLRRELEWAGLSQLEQVDGSMTKNRSEVIRRFAPYYNATPPELDLGVGEEIRILITTDVLSEGLNLQDASRMINYDIHWNPVRLMQRIGRVDRRMNPEIEKRMLAERPEVAASRGTVQFWNFLPPQELNKLLTLYRRVTQKTLLISKTLGIEGRKLLTPEDDYEALKEFNQAYEGTRTSVEEMHLEYQALLKEHPELEDRLKKFPGRIFSGRRRPAGGTRGVFFCYALPALDKERGEFTEDAGSRRWYYAAMADDTVLDDPGEIVANIRSTPKTRRRCTTEEKTLLGIRKRVERRIKNSYLKRVDAPVGVSPRMVCWMEVN